MSIFIASISRRCASTISSGALADPRAGAFRSLARRDGDRVLRDHRPHPRDILHRRLAAQQEQRSRESDDAAGDDGGVDSAIAIHPEHECQHEDGYRLRRSGSLRTPVPRGSQP
jgi:hypothetical protein